MNVKSINNKVSIIKFGIFDDIDWLGCGFSTRYGGVSKGCFSSMNMSFSRGDDPDDVRENIKIFSDVAGFDPDKIVMPHQCHTTNVCTVGYNECGRGYTKPGTAEEVDGQITNSKGVVLFCFGADCVPVFLADVEKKVVSACHAGWRGTVDDISGKAIDKMKAEFGCETKNIRAVIGPSICGECYEVGFDVAEKFLNRYTKKNEDRIQGIVRSVSSEKENKITGKFYLDLWEANRVNLLNAGIKNENIEISGCCTKCHPDMFFSHRVHGDARGVNVGYIFIRE